MSKIVDAYMETGSFLKACQIANMKPLFAHLALAKAGVLKIQDKINFGTESQKLGGEAERRFQEIFPEAIDANALWKRNNPVFDFNVWGVTVDVKYSSYRTSSRDCGKRQTKPYWGFGVRQTNGADIYFVFLENDETMDGLGNPYMLMIPSSMIHQKSSCNITKSSSYFKDFQVTEDEARDMMRGYAEMIGDIRTVSKIQQANRQLKEAANGTK